MVDKERFLLLLDLMAVLHKVHIFLLLVSSFTLVKDVLRNVKSWTVFLILQEADLVFLRCVAARLVARVDELARLLNDLVLVESLPKLH